MTDWGIGLKKICKKCKWVYKDYQGSSACAMGRTNKPFLTDKRCAYYEKKM